jgi:hypothetical protein
MGSFLQPLLLLVYGHLLVASGKLVVEEEWRGAKFFDGWQFMTYDDPTHGTVDYVSRATAERLGLIRTDPGTGAVTIGVDTASVVPPASRGRAAVRLESLRMYGPGRLFVFAVRHAPQGCGVWPAAWLCGADWPSRGEADLYEATNTANATQTTLHTGTTCDQSRLRQGADFTGTWATGEHGQPATDCWISAPGQYTNEGCGILAQDGTAGQRLNDGKGGVYALLWDSRGFRAWFWRHEKVPADLAQNRPVPESWGLPYSRFDFGDNCPASLFGDQTFVINTALCGDWAGSTFAAMCPEIGTSCDAFVRANPAAFTHSYWTINYLKIFVDQ